MWSTISAGTPPSVPHDRRQEGHNQAKQTKNKTPAPWNAVPDAIRTLEKLASIEPLLVQPTGSCRPRNPRRRAPDPEAVLIIRNSFGRLRKVIGPDCMPHVFLGTASALDHDRSPFTRRQYYSVHAVQHDARCRSPRSN
jgi:hypothetical protein